MHAAKEIIGMAIEHSEGSMETFPKLIYHMLGKLVAEGLLNEMDNGRTDIKSARNILQKQIDTLSQISKVVKLGIDRLSNAGSVLPPF